ncbi:hypothetical protein HZH66_003287 [Vespula vulgaris]|uniref:Uncharacterized protein n=1 Tax=Vespula vulgaris TaxID=7454 RepID=A0A834NG09_VESVU|nr:hypothetical protein HZH66_003287 [Vespula vulgaris]
MYALVIDIQRDDKDDILCRVLVPDKSAHERRRTDEGTRTKFQPRKQYVKLSLYIFVLLLLGNDWSPSRSGPKPHHGRWMKPDASTNDEEQRTLLYAGRKDAIFVCQRTSRCSGREVGRLF